MRNDDPNEGGGVSVSTVDESSELETREIRRQRGQELRKTCPRSSHGRAILGQATRDPLDLIEQSNGGRLKTLLPIRFTRMLESPFAFFRGTAIVQAHDLVNTPSAGVTVQCCGDCHLMNFGGFATPERLLVFEINDFDETMPAPFEWDVKRLATSFVLAARWLGHKENDARRAAQTVAEEYRHAQLNYSERTTLETWYAKVTYDSMLKDNSDDPLVTKIIRQGVAKAAETNTEHVYHKITRMVEGHARIADQPPLLFHGGVEETETKEAMDYFFGGYRASLPADRQALFNRYRIVDVAYKVVGVGSVGTRCYVVLLAGWQDDHLLLQVKEARASVLANMVGPMPYENNGERVVLGQRLMQSATDIFLGWSTGPKGRHYYVHQLRDIKLAPNIVNFTPRLLSRYARLCGATLARAHAKAGDATMIAGYLGNRETFDEAIRDYAMGYADQVEKDYGAFKKATRTGRFPTETSLSETESLIR